MAYRIRHWIALHDIRWIIATGIVSAVIVVCFAMGVPR